MAGGNVLVANTVNMTVSDPIIELGSNNINTGDLGIIMTRHNDNSNVAFLYDESDDILRIGYTLNGASSSVIYLDSNALAVSVQGTMTADKIVASNVIPATSSTTGALTVAGGLGVEGNVYIGSNLIVTDDTTLSNLSVTGNVHVGTAGQIVVSNAAQSTSSSTGALQIAGGLGVAGNVHVGSNIHVTGNVNKLNFTDGYTIKRGANVTVFGTTDVIQEITGPHARHVVPLRKYPEVALTTNTQSGYVASASSEYSINYQIWKAHDGETVFGTAPSYYYSAATQAYSTTNGSYTGATFSTTSSGTAYAGEYVQMQFPTPIKLSYVRIVSPDAGATYNKNSPKQGVICGSNDGTTWTTIAAYSGITYATLGASATIQAPSNVAYKYIRLVATHIEGVGSTGWLVIEELEYYGYEETSDPDTSVDTKITSKYNTPDLTSASLYIDGKKSGSTATDYSGNDLTVTENNVTYDSTEKSWTLSGAATSNIVSGDLGLEGDQPHSVSAWVKADVLGYGTPLFHLGTAEGEGDAASRVGFVDDSHISWGGEDHYFSNAEWHNVTYTYNGEGSDKKLYLDGRLVGTAANEDTFGDYPPFAMSTYSEYGYTVSASTDAYETATTPFYAWKAFNNTVGNEGWHAGEYQNGTDWYLTYVGNVGGAVYDTANYSRSIGGIDGEWLKLEMPHKLCVDYITLKSRTNSNDQAPKDFNILGSNDDVNWYVLSTHAGVTASATGETHTVGASKGYKYLTIVVTRVQRSTGSDVHLVIGELSYHGHRENDLVRFPDPTNVLKYPHVAMTGPAQRGYVATASSYRIDATYDYRPYKAFNEIFDSGPYAGWINQRTLTEYNGTDYLYNGSINLGTGAQNGEWIKLELPRKILMTSMKLYSRDNDTSRAPEDFIVYGSNDDTNWTELLSEVGATPADTGTTYTADTATTYYKYFALVVRKIVAQNNFFTIDNIEYHGTEEDADVIARVGDGYDGKVRNLRVFSTALSQDRVQEIFDADKDEFGLAKSSVSVYRGHLGIGTTEPKAALTVMDEVGELEEFPPRAMTAAETYMDGHGVFKASVSEYTGAAVHAAWNAFAHGAAEFWLMGQHAGYNLVSGEYEDNEFRLSSETSMGQWIKLEIPYLTNVTKFILKPRLPGAEYQAPKSGELWGSKDNHTWTKLHTFTDIQYYAGHTTFKFENSEFYKYYGLVVTKVGGGHASNDYIGIVDLRFFGTREQGASTLHNGELTLTRNLTVPRIGPALDADDTPRRDRLVVEYNTSTNPTENGLVKDTSGRGLDGLLDNTYGGAAYNPYYDATEKALVFDGSNDYVFQNDVHLKTGVGGVYSASVWVRNRASSGTHTVYSLGTYAQLTTSTLYVLDTTLQVVFYNSDLSVTYTIPKNTWTNIVVTHGGGQTSTTTKMYINGVDVGLAAMSGTSFPLSTVNFPSPCNLFLGKNSTNSVYGGPMDLSNFKLWDMELSADDAKRLYDMGRLGNVIAQPVHIAAPLYAPGTIVQVESSTKYDTFSATGLNTHPLSPGNDVPGLSVTIHPKFANSKILISYDVNMGSYGRAYLRIQRTQGGNVTAIEAPIGPAGSTTEGKSTSSTTFGSSTNNLLFPASFTHYDNADSTLPITYQIQAWTYHSTYYVHINRAHQDHNGTTNNSTYWARTLSSITAKEVCQ